MIPYLKNLWLFNSFTNSPQSASSSSTSTPLTMPRTIQTQNRYGDSLEEESDKENSLSSPIKKRPKRTANELKFDPLQAGSSRANATVKTEPQFPAAKTIRKTSRSVSSDLSAVEEYLPRKVESSSSDFNPLSSRDSSTEPKFGHSQMSSTSSSTGSSSNSRSLRKHALAKITEDTAFNKMCEDPTAIIFDIGNFNPIGPDSSSDEDDDDEEEATNKICCLGDYIREPDIKPDSTTNDYEVERILLIQIKGNVKFYLVKWKDYPLYQSSWAKEKDLHTCDKVLKIFEERKALCRKIFESLPNQKDYMGFEDHYVKSFMTTSLIEQNHFEVSLVPFMQDNKFAPLYIENWTRFCDVYPKKFVWCSESLFSYATSLEVKKIDAENKKKPSTTCDCEPCMPATCPCLKSSITSRGFLRAEMTNFINECHKECKCCSKCPSKVFRRGRTIPIMLFRTPKCGWSVRTMVKIPNRKFVMEYVGLYKLFRECEDIVDQTYLFNCDCPDGTVKYVIDATDYGNESRFINHHCNPNLEAFSVLGYHSDPRMTRIVFFSNRVIEAGEELTFNYFRDVAIPEDIDPKEKRVCRCGAANCRKYLV